MRRSPTRFLAETFGSPSTTQPLEMRGWVGHGVPNSSGVRLRTRRLPAVVDVGPDQPLVDLGDPCQLLFGERRERGAGCILLCLVGIAGAGDDDADAGLVDHPA